MLRRDFLRGVAAALGIATVPLLGSKPKTPADYGLPPTLYGKPIVIEQPEPIYLVIDHNGMVFQCDKNTLHAIAVERAARTEGAITRYKIVRPTC